MILGFLLLAWMSKTCYAEIADVTAFENLEWKKVHEEALIAPQGVVQSICATKIILSVLKIRTMLRIHLTPCLLIIRMTRMQMEIRLNSIRLR